ncbi:MAG: sulfatase [Elusimicrobiota bacterium]|jgi:arylsulfatase A-like enzyme
MRFLRRLIFLAALLAALLPSAAFADEPGAQGLCPGCNLVLIGMDDVRADRLAFTAESGARTAKTPNLDRFAKEAQVFTQAISAASWTLPSFMSVFTARHPSRHGLTNRYADFAAEPLVLSRLQDRDPSARTLAEVLRAKGYRTAAFTGGAGLTGASGFSRGFEVYSDSVSFGGFSTSVPQALGWLKDRAKGEPFFLFVHGYDAHGFHPEHWSSVKEAERFRGLRKQLLENGVMDASAAERENIVKTYERSLGSMDEALAPLLKALEARQDTVVVLFADHGEELFEHGGIDHGRTLEEEVLRVPLLFRVPGAKPRRVLEQVRLLDIMPTLLDALAVGRDARLDAQLEGLSLVPLLRGETLALDAFSETDFLLQSSLRSLRDHEGWKLVRDMHAGISSLFDLNKDPQAKLDVSSEHPEKTRALEKRLLDAFAPRPLNAKSRASLDGRWKLSEKSGGFSLYDMALDPLESLDLSSQEPRKAQELAGRLLREAASKRTEAQKHEPSPELIKRIQKEGYW